MSLISKSTKSYVKQEYQNSRCKATGYVKVKFADKPGEGATGIDTSSLTAPTELTSNGFTNPNSATLAGLKLKQLRNNLTVRSSLRGDLEDYADYVVADNGRINFVGFTAEEEEYFTCIMDAQPTQGIQVVDASAIRATGTLSAGQTDIVVGPYEASKYLSAQIGQVMVILDGVIQFRNTSNATAAPGADGNYQEVDAGKGLGTIIRLNEADPTEDRDYIIVSTEALAERPDDSMLAYIESLAGQVDVMIQDLALATGNPTTKYQTQANEIDLTSFGENVYENTTGLSNISEGGDATNGPRLASDSVSGAVSYYNSVELDLDNNFTDGTVKITRVGDQVTITGLDTPTHASLSEPATSSGFLPTWARPATTIENLFFANAGRLRRVRVAPDGTLTCRFLDWAGGAVSEATSDPVNIAFNV